MIDTLLKDLRYAVRTLRKSPAFTAVVVLSLALGIGATSTIFSAINPILLRPLPFADPDRLVYISENSPDQPDVGKPPRFATYLEWKEHNSAFEHLESVASYVEVETASDIPGTVGPERVGFQAVSPGLFRMLGVAPILGRNFVAKDAPPGGDYSAIIISHGFWQRLFRGDPNIIGEKLGDSPIVGIMPPGFRIFSWNEADVWESFTDWGAGQRWLESIGRLKPGVSIEGAQTQLDGIARRLDQSWVSDESGWRVRVEPLHEYTSGQFTSHLYLLLAAAVLLLLIACSNVASLLMGRAATRHHEITTRAALGAGRLRLMRQLLTESVVLALAGGALGVVMAQVGTRLFVILAPYWYLPAEEIRVDGIVLGFTLGLSLLTAILFGMAPALRASNPDLVGTLKQGGRGSVGGSGLRIRNLLVGSQIALTFVLLVGAALMINSLVRLVALDRGFNPEHLLTATVDLQGDRYMSQKGESPQDVFVVSAEVDLFYGELLERLRVLPGVEAAEIASVGYGGAGFMFSILGRPVPPPGERPPWALYRETSPGYFRAMGVPLLKGRSFTEGDTESSPWVAIITERIARQYFPDEDPIGRFLQTPLLEPNDWRAQELPPATISRDRGHRGRYHGVESQACANALYLCTAYAAPNRVLAGMGCLQIAQRQGTGPENDSRAHVCGSRCAQDRRGHGPRSARRDPDHAGPPIRYGPGRTLLDAGTRDLRDPGPRLVGRRNLRRRLLRGGAAHP